MLEILRQLDMTQLLIFALTTVGGALIVWYRKKLAGWRKFWRGVFEGLNGIPELQADLKGIRYYVAPNGGGSLMDSAKRTEAAVLSLGGQMEMVVQTMWAENDADDDIGRFHTDAEGGNTYVNQLYARWLGVGKADLMGWNYLNYMHPEDSERVRKHWDRCIGEHRQYRLTHRMVDTDGVAFEVRVVATPIPEKGPIQKWIGSIRRTDAHDRRKNDRN